MSLELLSIRRRFGREVALDGVDLHVRSGDCYGLIGHNGAGKTTAMRIALGLQRADSGRVLVDGFDAARYPREARARLSGLIETPGFHGHRSGFANLVELARLQGFSRDSARKEAALQIGRVGLDHAADRRVQGYSQGMRQRLGIAQALLGHPACVLLDEPTNGLDPEGIAEVRALILRLVRDDGLTVMVSSHQLHELTGLCNRVAVLKRGRVVIEQETEKLLAQSRGRYRLATPDVTLAREVLQRSSIGIEPRGDGLIDLDLDAEKAPRAAAELVRAGVRMTSFAPENATLEEIYLRLARAQPGGDATSGSTPDEIARGEIARVGKSRDGDARDGDARDGDAHGGDAHGGDERDGNVRDGNVRDGSTRDGNERDSKERDSNERDSNERDSNERDSNARERNARDGGARDGGARDGGARDGGAREGGAREGGAREGGAREGGARKRDARDVKSTSPHVETIAGGSTPRSSPATENAPPVRRAPTRPLSRVYGYEARRLAARVGPALLLVLPAVLAASAVAWRSSQAHADARDIAGQKLFSATDVTAFEGVGLAIQAGVPLLAFIALGIASQSIASEFSGGTLRNVLLRPVRRWQVVLGKTLACLSIAAGGYVLLALSALLSARAFFQFTDVSEILPNGARFALVPANELWPALWSALAAPILPLFAYTVLGLLAGTIVRGAAGGLALALFLGVGLDLARIVGRAFGVEGLLLSAYLPSPLGDTSSVRVFVETAQGISNAHFDFARTAYVVPIAWLFASLVISILVLGRRPIP